MCSRCDPARFPSLTVSLFGRPSKAGGAYAVIDLAIPPELLLRPHGSDGGCALTLQPTSPSLGGRDIRLHSAYVARFIQGPTAHSHTLV